MAKKENRTYLYCSKRNVTNSDIEKVNFQLLENFRDC